MKKPQIEQFMKIAIEESLVYINEMAERLVMPEQTKEAELKAQERKASEKIKVNKTQDVNDNKVDNYVVDAETAMTLAFRITKDYFKQYPQEHEKDKREFLITWLNQVLLGMMQNEDWQSGHNLKTMSYNLRYKFVDKGIASFVDFIKASLSDNESVLKYQSPPAKKVETQTAKPVKKPVTMEGEGFLATLSYTLRLNGYETVADASHAIVEVFKGGHKIATLQMRQEHLVVMDAGTVFAENLTRATEATQLVKNQFVTAIQSDISNEVLMYLTNQVRGHIIMEETAMKQNDFHEHLSEELLSMLNSIMAVTEGIH